LIANPERRITMIANRLFIIVMLASVVLAACGPAATGEPIAVAPQPTYLVEATEAPAVEAPEEFEVPAATEAPALIAPAPTQAAGDVGLWPTPAPTAPADMFFQQYGVNPFISAQADHLSTFALDVDTASYTVARRYVTDGNLPPAEAIRVEEFVNYFRQDYAAPADAAFALFADGAPSPFHQDGSQILRFGIQGYSVPEAERAPASLTFVIDVSGSMDMENRLGLVKQSLQLLVDRLRPSDTVGIVVYGSEARVVLNPTSGEDRATILDAIYSLRPEGATNAEAGLRLGYQMANLAYRPGAINRVILCSDGVANVGETGPEAILESIRGYADAGITLTSVGFGMGNFNDVLMEQLADNGDGNYAYVDTLDEARRLFVDNLTSTLQVIALNAKVQVDFNPETVAVWRLIGYENRAVADQDFRNNAVDAGEIGAGHTVTALYAVQFIQPAPEGRIATVSLRWEDPKTHAVQEINGNFNTWDLARGFEDASPRYQLDVVVAQYAEILRRSPWAEGTHLEDLRVRADRLAAQMPEDADVAEFASLVARASLIYGW
jgi:Ca-activated chloride channel family protein